MMPKVEVKQLIVRRKEIQKMTSLSWSTIQRMVKAGEFPPPFALNKRSIGWKSSDVEAWLNGLEERK